MPDQKQDHGEDPGAYIGHEPERATETIPGGVGPDDERVAAHATQRGPQRGPAPASTEGSPPRGHREGPPTTDDELREAGENH